MWGINYTVLIAFHIIDSCGHTKSAGTFSIYSMDGAFLNWFNIYILLLFLNFFLRLILKTSKRIFFVLFLGNRSLINILIMFWLDNFSLLKSWLLFGFGFIIHLHSSVHHDLNLLKFRHSILLTCINIHNIYCWFLLLFFNILWFRCHLCWWLLRRWFLNLRLFWLFWCFWLRITVLHFIFGILLIKFTFTSWNHFFNCVL